MTVPDHTSLIDLHNHLVPGVDDGARDVESVLHAVERMTRLGVRRIVTTPHIQGSLTLEPGRCERRLSEVGEAFEFARQAVASGFPEVEFRRGHEVLIDVPEVDFSDPRIRLAGTSFVLIEWPRLMIPPGTDRVIESIVQQGYRPIIAHPERYTGMVKSLALAQQWRASGAFLQVNYGSLVGRYGSEARVAAYRLLRQGWVDYLASDFHGHRTLKIYKEEAEREFGDRDAMYAFEMMSRTNPARLLEDHDPLAVPSLPPDPGFILKLKGMLNRERA